MKRRPMAMLLIAALGAYIASAAHLPIWSVAAILLITTCSLAVKSLTDRAFMRMLLPVFLCLFYIVFAGRLGAIDAQRMRAAFAVSEGVSNVSGKVTDIGFKNGVYYIYMDRARAGDENIGGALICSYSLTDDEGRRVCVGGRISASGELECFKSAGLEFEFDEEMYYRAKGYYSRIFDAGITVLEEKHGLLQNIYVLRETLKNAIYRVSPYEDAGVFSAIVLGDKSGLQSELKELYKEGGISHILAISGLHVSFIRLLLFGILRKCGVNYAVSAALSSGVMIVYAILTGAGVSVIRASIMFIISVTALVFGRTYDIISAMALSWIVIVIINPYQATQAGCLLSFGAIVAIGVVMPAINRLFPVKNKLTAGERIGERIRNALVGTVSISLVTFPILAWFYYYIAVLSLLLNLIVIPLMSILMASVLIAIAIYLAVGGTPIGLLIAKGAVMPASFILHLNTYLCELAGRVDWNKVVTGRPKPWQIMLYYGVLVGLVPIIYHIGTKIELNRPKGSKKRTFGICLTYVAFLLGMLATLTRFRQKDDQVIFLDVGQGECIYVMSGGMNVLIDGGSTSRENVSTVIDSMLMFYRTTHIDAWIISHPDIDHYSGTRQLIEGGDIDIDKIIATHALPMEELTEVFIMAQAADAEILTMAEGDSLVASNAVFTCLYPREDEVCENINDLSLVLMLDICDRRILLTGDITQEGEMRLLGRYADALKSDVLKVSHHGSKYSSNEAFVEAVSPVQAIISCGINNYGHPADRVLEVLWRCGAKIHITLSDGSFAIKR